MRARDTLRYPAMRNVAELFELCCFNFEDRKKGGQRNVTRADVNVLREIIGAYINLFSTAHSSIIPPRQFAVA